MYYFCCLNCKNNIGLKHEIFNGLLYYFCKNLHLYLFYKINFYVDPRAIALDQ